MGVRIHGGNGTRPRIRDNKLVVILPIGGAEQISKASGDGSWDWKWHENLLYASPHHCLTLPLARQPLPTDVIAERG